MSEPLNDYTREYASKVLATRHEYLEAMTAAYIRMTALPPDQAVLCEQFKDGVTRWWFERKEVADQRPLAPLPPLEIHS